MMSLMDFTMISADFTNEYFIKKLKPKNCWGRTLERNFRVDNGLYINQTTLISAQNSDFCRLVQSFNSMGS